MSALLALLLACAPAAMAQDDDYDASPTLIPVGNLNLFYSSSGPLSFEAMTPKDVPPGAVRLPGEFKARSCQYALNVPIAASLNATKISAAVGNGSYRKALDGLRKKHPELAGIYDIRVDAHTISILGIFRRLCTEVTARGFK